MKTLTRILLPALMSLLMILGFQNCSDVGFDQAATQGSLTYPDPKIPQCRNTTAPEVKPKLKWDWYAKLDSSKPESHYRFSQVMATPLVKDLDGNGIPEVVFVSFSLHPDDHLYPEIVHHNQNGVLRIVNGKDGSTIRSIGGDELAPHGSQTPLLVDLDRDGFTEILYIHHSQKSLVALSYTGDLRWKFTLPRTVVGGVKLSSYYSSSKGGVIVAVDNMLYTENAFYQPQKVADIQSPSGNITSLFFPLNPSQPSQVSHINMYGVYSPENGGLLYQFPHYAFTAVADLDGSEPGLEVVGMQAGKLFIVNPTSQKTLVTKDLTPYNSLLCPNKGIGGGPPSIGNFDGDSSTTEIAIATGKYLTLFTSKGELLSQIETQDCSSLVTGISSFDFNGDNKPEIIYADEEYLRIYEVKNGQLTEVFKEINPSGTLYEYPVVVDVDGNGSSELIVAANSYHARGLYKNPGEEGHSNIALNVTGVRAFEASTEQAWMPTRPVWSQYSYNPLMELIGSDTDQNLKSLFSGYLSRTFRRNSQLGVFESVCL